MSYTVTRKKEIMRIHSSVLNASDVEDIVREVAKGYVTVEGAADCGSRKRAGAVELRLSGSSNYKSQGGDYKAATWDEWGIVIHGIFERDGDAIVGKYDSLFTFDNYTQGRFDDLTPVNQHKRHKWVYYAPRQFECKCGAMIAH